MLELTVTGAEPILREFEEYPRRAQRAIVRALNRAIRSGQTVMVRDIAGDTGLKQKDVRDAMRLRLASASHPEASLGTNLKRIPLIKFGARGPEPSRGRGRGVSYRLAGSKGRLEHAFIATMGSGHRGVFLRKAQARLPIRELHGPSRGHVFRKFRARGLERANDVFMTNLEHELDFSRTEAAGAGTD